MCKLLKVSRAGYYKYLNHIPSKRSVENEALKEYIKDVHNQFKMCYGYRRIKSELDARGIIVNHNAKNYLLVMLGLSGQELIDDQVIYYLIQYRYVLSDKKRYKNIRKDFVIALFCKCFFRCLVFTLTTCLISGKALKCNFRGLREYPTNLL